MLFDTHCHLDFAAFADDRDAVIERAVDTGVTALCIPAVTCEMWPQLLAFSDKRLQTYKALGLHPCFMEQHSPEHLVALDEALSNPQVCAVGEVGLDFSQPHREQQQWYFAEQVKLAIKHNLPLIVHARKSVDAVLHDIRRLKHTHGGILHNFVGSEQQAKQAMELGFLLGFGGGVTYPRASKTRQLVARLPLTHIVLETDAPDMPLCGFQGERNEPSRLLQVAQTVAQLRGVSLELVAEQTFQNAQRMFERTGNC